MTITIKPLEWFNNIYEVLLYHLQHPTYFDGIILTCFILRIVGIVIKTKAKWYQRIVAVVFASVLWPLVLLMALVLLGATCGNILLIYLNIIEKYWWED